MKFPRFPIVNFLRFPREFYERMDHMSAIMSQVNTNLSKLVEVAPKLIDVVERLGANKEDTAWLTAVSSALEILAAQFQTIVDANPPAVVEPPPVEPTP